MPRLKYITIIVFIQGDFPSCLSDFSVSDEAEMDEYSPEEWEEHLEEVEEEREEYLEEVRNDFIMEIDDDLANKVERLTALLPELRFVDIAVEQGNGGVAPIYEYRYRGDIPEDERHSTRMDGRPYS